MVFCVAVNLFSSRVLLAIASASLRVSDVVYQSQGLQENIALVLGVGVVADWGPCHRLKKW